MLTFNGVVALLGLNVTPKQARACRYLERKGRVFCVHFGYENAGDQARLARNRRRRACRKYRARKGGIVGGKLVRLRG